MSTINRIRTFRTGTVPTYIFFWCGLTWKIPATRGTDVHLIRMLFIHMLLQLLTALAFIAACSHATAEPAENESRDTVTSSLRPSHL
jgi:hypothetical protein